MIRAERDRQYPPNRFASPCPKAVNGLSRRDNRVHRSYPDMVFLMSGRTSAPTHQPSPLQCLAKQFRGESWGIVGMGRKGVRKFPMTFFGFHRFSETSSISGLSPSRSAYATRDHRARRYGLVCGRVDRRYCRHCLVRIVLRCRMDHGNRLTLLYLCSQGQNM